MSLDTVLKIGRLLRNSSRRLDFFSYVAPCPKKDAKGNYPLCLDIPVNENYDIDFDNISIVPERERDKLYYLKYKTSDKDTSTKYIYGDIYYSVSGTMSSNGKSVSITYDSNYRLGTIGPNGKNKGNAFDKAEGEFDSICQQNNVEELVNLRNGIRRGRSVLEKMMKYMPAVIHFFEEGEKKSFYNFINQEDHDLKTICCQLNKDRVKKENLEKFNKLSEDDQLKLNTGRLYFHFSYQGKQWYEFTDAFEKITRKMLNEFVLPIGRDCFELQKTIWPTLCSGDKKNDIQFPDFSPSGRYKSRYFSSEEIKDLFYAVPYAKKGNLIPATDYKIVVLPRGENITAEDLIEFRDNEGNEDTLRNSNEYSDNLVSSILGVCSAITSFDFLFLRNGGSKPDTVLIELSNITRSNLSYTNQRIKQIAHKIYKEREDEITLKDPKPFEIPRSFVNILGEVQFDEKKNIIKFVDSKKYQSHILWALASIYQGNYYNDESLLHSFVKNVETTIRLGKGLYRYLKYDLKFLLSIQNSQSNKYMEIIDSKSYQLGVKLGKIAKPLKKAIKPFEKNYVGLLSRRISTKDDCISFVNDVCQKLVMHDSAWPASCAEVCTELAELPVTEYDADKLAFGFFEGYFRYEPSDKKKSFQKRLESLVSDYEGNEDLKVPIDQLQAIIAEIDKQD